MNNDNININDNNTSDAEWDELIAKKQAFDKWMFEHPDLWDYNLIKTPEHLYEEYLFKDESLVPDYVKEVNQGITEHNKTMALIAQMHNGHWIINN